MAGQPAGGPQLTRGPGRRAHAQVRLADLPGRTGAFVTNSRGIAPVGRIDGTAIPVSPALAQTVHGVYDSVPWDLV